MVTQDAIKYEGRWMFANMKIQGLQLHLDNEKMIKSQVESISHSFHVKKKINKNCPKLKQLKTKPSQIWI